MLFFIARKIKIYYISFTLLDIKGNYFSEGKIMKLAKTVIVSGLLFSSVLGSVNVGSITTMAANNSQTSARTLGPVGLPKPGDTSKPITKKTISIKYVDRYGVEEKRTNFVEKSQKTIEVNSNAQEIPLSNIILPEWYVFLDKGSVRIDNNNSVTIKVKKNKVDTTGITELTPPEIITPDEQEQQSHELQLTAPDIISVGKPDNTTNNKPQTSTTKSVQLKFIDKDAHKTLEDKTKTVEVPNADKSTTVTEDVLPDGYQFENDVKQMNFRINSSKDGQNVIYIAIVKKSNNVATQKNVTVKFVDAKTGKSIPSGVQTFQVNKADRTITIDSKNLPSGYKLANGKNEITLDINKDGSIQVKVESTKAVSTPTPAPNKPAKPTVKPSKRPSGAHYTIQRVRITFVDQNSKNLVGYKQVTGKASFSTKIEAPKGYSFTNEKDATIKFDKKGNKDIKIFVKKMTSAPVKHEGVVTTTNGSYKRLYTLEGKMITNRALGVNSKWYTDQYATINGEKMYRVATNEWVKASDVK